MKRHTKNLFAIGTFFLCCCNLALADSPAEKSQYTFFNPTPADQLRGMDTDRPNITNTPHTIDAGHFQLESGFVDYAYDHTDGVRTDDWSVCQFNLRAGVLNNLELNVAINAFEYERVHDSLSGRTSHQSSFGDTIVGGKLNIWGNESGETTWETALAIQPQLKIPTAREEIGNGHAEFSAGFPFAMDLPGQFHLSLQTAVEWERNSSNSGDVAGWANAAAIDHEFGKLDIYLEYASDLTTEKHQETEQTIDVGGIFQLTDNLTLDTGFNIGLNSASNDFEWLLGMSVRR
jgi:hypothetical protein